MSRLSPYLGIVVALAIGVLLATFSGGTTLVRIPETIVIPDITIVTPAEKPVETTHIAPPITSSTHSSVVVVETESVADAISVEALNAALDASATTLRGALVNIICSVPAGSGFHSISGSGVIIDPKGIILTNAHIAQYFLLADRSVSCVIRSGSPARDRYNASPIYISPAWLRANPNVLTEKTPNGTGERDFALLAIYKSATTAPLPSSFPFVPIAIAPSRASTPIVIASYGAQFLPSSQITSYLSPTVVFGSIKEVFTFGANTIDVLALGGSAAAQEGSSGGGVVDASGELVGMITTSTITGATDTRSLNAISASYIRAAYASETGQAIDLLLAQSPATAISNFASEIPTLEAIITTNLSN